MSGCVDDDRSNNPLEPEAFPELASVLRSQTGRIMQQWDEMARQAQQVIGDLNLAEMTDHIPAILGMLADLLEDPTRQHMQTLVEGAPEHGLARFRQHYDVPQLMTEGRLLRRVIIGQVEAALGRQMRQEESIALHTGIDILLQGGILAMVEQQRDALHESETRYRTLFDSIDEGFCIIEILFDGGGATPPTIAFWKPTLPSTNRRG